ncbi:STAS domain-containing protein [Caldimonas tepidiphila]|uniref:STAS domain-containing protein n=1 Tax=Caldimonas tepidiphila TaxID=2315841 RepID=UPI000E5C00A7|nr:STAS domain-containing protein [Caldimonas tepidiphila]
MSDTKDNGGFLRKVVRFVSHPTTEWSELGHSTHGGARETEYAKSELKAAIERKRRNDFVRKREFDMLRKVRREGLNEAVLGAMGQLHLDSEVRMSDLATRSDVGVKAKIDAIEQQMVGEGMAPPRTRAAAGAAATAPARPAAAAAQPARPVPPRSGPVPAPEAVPTLQPQPVTPLPARTAPPSPAAPANAAAAAAPLPAARASAASPAAAPPANPAPAPASAALYDPFAVEVNEVVHDPELDEIVIAFANADFAGSEATLRALVEPGGARARHPETWLALFDLYRATGQQAKFESLALEFARGFGLSAPQWFSLPRMAAEIDAPPPADDAAAAAGAESAEEAVQEAGWVCPEDLDEAGVRELRARAAHLPAPWVLDWSHLQRIVPSGVGVLHETLAGWCREPLEMRWRGADRLLGVLQEATPTGAREVEPANWLLRLEALRLVNRPDQFDEVAIDYCVTYEVSPPSWEPARCQVQLEGDDAFAQEQPLTRIGEVSTMFVESQLTHEPSLIELASVELCGQLVGDISGLLHGLEQRLGSAAIVNVCCTRLIRVDFIAAGDLLNWVLARRTEGRTVVFEEAHRLLALFFGAMGITEHARVKVRNV